MSSMRVYAHLACPGPALYRLGADDSDTCADCEAGTLDQVPLQDPHDANEPGSRSPGKAKQQFGTHSSTLHSTNSQPSADRGELGALAVAAEPQGQADEGVAAAAASVEAAVQSQSLLPAASFAPVFSPSYSPLFAPVFSPNTTERPSAAPASAPGTPVTHVSATAPAVMPAATPALKSAVTLASTFPKGAAEPASDLAGAGQPTPEAEAEAVPQSAEGAATPAGQDLPEVASSTAEEASAADLLLHDVSDTSSLFSRDPMAVACKEAPVPPQPELPAAEQTDAAVVEAASPEEGPADVEPAIASAGDGEASGKQARPAAAAAAVVVNWKSGCCKCWSCHCMLHHTTVGQSTVAHGTSELCQQLRRHVLH